MSKQWFEINGYSVWVDCGSGEWSCTCPFTAHGSGGERSSGRKALFADTPEGSLRG